MLHTLSNGNFSVKSEMKKFQYVKIKKKKHEIWGNRSDWIWNKDLTLQYKPKPEPQVQNFSWTKTWSLERTLWDPLSLAQRFFMEKVEAVCFFVCFFFSWQKTLTRETSLGSTWKMDAVLTWNIGWRHHRFNWKKVTNSWSGPTNWTGICQV